MMQKLTTRTFLVRLAGLGLGAMMMSQAAAQSLAETEPPAELPPESFEGREYVDSRGCVYIRAGIDGNTTWVPRVTRTREPVCGMIPTFAEGAPPPDTMTEPDTTETAEAEEMPVEELAEELAEDAAEEMAEEMVEDAAEEMAEEMAEDAVEDAVVAEEANPVPMPRPALDPSEAPRELAQVSINAEPEGAAYLPPSNAIGAPGSSDGAAVSHGMPRAKYSRVTVRRGVVRAPGTVQVRTPATRVPPMYGGTGYRAALVPNKNPINVNSPMLGGTGYRAARLARPSDAGLRVLPRHLYEDPTRDRTGLKVPKGFRMAWTDDRTNPRRAEQSVAGVVATQLVWTKTVPRQLIDQSTGQDASARYPMLYFPFTDLAMQRRYEADRDRYEVRMSAAGKVRLVEKRGAATVSTRSAAPKATRPAVQPKATQVRAAPAGHKYVQVGTYGDASAIRSAIGQLQGMGMRAATQKVHRNGQAHQAVLAGPFASTADVARALARLRGAGYSQAFTR